MKILLLDNYDSFTYNLLHYLQNSGARVEVFRHDELSEDAMKMEGFDALVISPGPKTPYEAGSMTEMIRQHAHKKPILGICLGMQGIGIHFGWSLKKAKLPVHGKFSLMQHSESGIFENLSNPMQIGRYHSLIVSPSDASPLKPLAFCEEEVMAVSTVDEMIMGVQFHPESILTPQGQQLINNWVRIAQKLRDEVVQHQST